MLSESIRKHFNCVDINKRFCDRCDFQVGRSDYMISMWPMSFPVPRPSPLHLNIRAFERAFYRAQMEDVRVQWNDGPGRLLAASPIAPPTFYVHDESDEAFLSDAETESTEVACALKADIEI